MQSENSLEDIVKSESKVKSGIVNSLTGVVFYTPVMFAYETFIRGYPIDESLEIRTKAALLGMVLYGVYGPFRNLVSYLTNTTKLSSEKKKTTVETASSYVFNAAVYAGLLIQNGSKPLDAIGTALLGTIFVGITGRPYGQVLDKVRKRFHLPSVYE